MKRNKKQSVDKYLYPAYKMGWDMVSWVLAQKVSEILGHEVRCVARWEDTTYWGAVAVGYRFPIAEIEALMCAVGADAESCPDAIPVDDDSSFSLSMELSQFLLQDALTATWECELFTPDEIWLINFRVHADAFPKKTEGEFWLPGKVIPMDKLKSRTELLTYLEENGATHAALMDFCEVYREQWQNELCWSYPISDGKHLGTFLIWVREGVLSLPYDEAEADDGEIFIPEEAFLCKAEDIAVFLEDWRSYDQELQAVMQIMKEVLWKKEVQHG